MIRILALAVFSAVVAVGDASAHDYQLRALHIDHPFARATPGGARNGGVYLSVENRGDQADRLIGVSTPVARAELHQMSVDAGVMRMRAVDGIDVKAGGRLVLQPGAYHVMLTDLKRPLQAGDSFPMTLAFEKAGSIEVSVVVESIAAGVMPGHSNR